ncbi:MAG: hypothetical protein JO127_04675 [Caulobacteraceae bacterium]|nr:hypothetical protein [Caulobacteraceae bacterium]
MAYDIGPLEGGEARGASRLLALAAYLETVADAEYDHRAWRRGKADGSWAMCALGHGLSALPDLIGLRWRSDDGDDVVRLDGSGLTEDPMRLAAEAFELSLEEAAMVFGVGLKTAAFYGEGGALRITPNAVSRAIRALALAKVAGARRAVAA